MGKKTQKKIKAIGIDQIESDFKNMEHWNIERNARKEISFVKA